MSAQAQAQRQCSTKPFAGPDDPVTSTCWDCGYTWLTGKNGSHSCAVELQRRLELANRVVAPLLELFRPFLADWERANSPEAIAAFGGEPFPLPETVTLTANFPAHVLRDLLGESTDAALVKGED